MGNHAPVNEYPQALSRSIMDILAVAPDSPNIRSETAQIIEAARTDGSVDHEWALNMAGQRAKGDTMPQILGAANFMGLDLTFTAGVCAVRKETELLGWQAVERLRAAKPAVGESQLPLRAVDLGSGSGNLTCGIAMAVPNLQMWAIDIDPACTALTKENVKRHELSDRVEILTGDLFAPLADCGLEGSFDAVVCNPPYIASIRLRKDRAYLLDHEPKAAFDGGPFGISIQLRLAKEALAFLKPGGWLLFEIGVGQHRQVRQIIERTAGYDIIDFAQNREGEFRVSCNRKCHMD